MSKHIRYKYIKQIDTSFFHISSKELDSDLSFIRNNKIKNVVINYISEYKFNNIDFLYQLPDLEKIVVTTSSKNFCLDGLRYCNKLLELKVNNFSNSIVDLSKKKELKILDVENFSKLKSIEDCVNLEKLISGKIPKKNFTRRFWSIFSKLRYLCISNTQNISSFDFLREIDIKSLFLYRCKNVNFLGVDSLFLEDLKIEKCTNALNDREIYKNINLKSLAIIDSFCVESANLVCEMHSLERLILLGKSYFVNGDLSMVGERFKVFSFDEKEHYIK